jgi:hypothetical protein
VSNHRLAMVHLPLCPTPPHIVEEFLDILRKVSHPFPPFVGTITVGIAGVTVTVIGGCHRRQQP